MKSSALLAIAALGLTSIARSAAPGPSVTAGEALVFEAPTDDPLFLPTDVAVDAAGRVWVADGANHRVAVFGIDGRWQGAVLQVGGIPLAKPMGVDVDPDGNLWIADAERNEVLVRSPDGALIRRLELPSDLAPGADLTDVAVTPDGERAWVVDNEQHRLLVFDLHKDEVEVFGEPGQALGQMDHPYLIAANRDGNVFYTDVLNGRVQGASPRRTPRADLGRYGVELGELYRPKGVAVDDSDHVWVSDGELGVVQVFNSTGSLVDVVRDEGGAVLHFDTPGGVAWADDRLYVVEAIRNRVLRLPVELIPGRRPPREARPVLDSKPKDCTSCHVELMPMLAQGLPTEIARVPLHHPDQPPASREVACFSCHDGSVEDSRRPVWLEHGHGADVEPPEGMEIDPAIPLVEGHLACRSCHTAHSHGGSGRSCAEAVFLRVGEEPMELCVACHGDMNQRRAPTPSDHDDGDAVRPSGHLSE